MGLANLMPEELKIDDNQVDTSQEGKIQKIFNLF